MVNVNVDSNLRFAVLTFYKHDGSLSLTLSSFQNSCISITPSFSSLQISYFLFPPWKFLPPLPKPSKKFSKITLLAVPLLFAPLLTVFFSPSLLSIFFFFFPYNIVCITDFPFLLLLILRCRWILRPLWSRSGVFLNSA